MRKPGKKGKKTWKIFGNSSNQLVYAAAITVIKTARAENIIKKCNIFVPISVKYHKWTFQDLHQKWKEIRTRWKQNTKLSTSKQDPPHSKHWNNVYVPLTIDSRYQRRQKQYQRNNHFINKQSKLFDELQGNRITIMEPPTTEDAEKFWKPLYENLKEHHKDAAWLQE